MRFKFDFDVNIAGGARAGRTASLTGQPNGLTGEDALGDLHVERTLFCCNVSGRVDFRNPQREGSRAPLECRVQIQHHFGMGVLAASGVDALAAAARRSGGAEQRLEEIAVIRITGTGAGPWTAELKACTPIGRGTELLAGTRTRSQLVVGGALFRGPENLIRFADFLEPSFGVL